MEAARGRHNSPGEQVIQALGCHFVRVAYLRCIVPLPKKMYANLASPTIRNLPSPRALLEASQRNFPIGIAVVGLGPLLFSSERCKSDKCVPRIRRCVDKLTQLRNSSVSLDSLGRPLLPTGLRHNVFNNEGGFIRASAGRSSWLADLVERARMTQPTLTVNVRYQCEVHAARRGRT